MIFDKELRAEVKIQRDAVYGLLNYYLPKRELTKVGDSEICLGYSFDYGYKSVSLECNMYGNWQYVELQDEAGRDNYRYSQDLELNHESPANDIVNALMELL
jgi:hypothetical protein